MLKWLQLSHPSHTGRLRPHAHTSYVSLGILLLLVGIILSAYTTLAITHPGPGAGSIGLSGVMPAKPPTIAAVITVPGSGQRFSSSPVTFSGTCPASTLVEIFKNDIFAGSTPCGDNGKFSVDIDLLIGQNTLVARVYDALDQPGPDSNQVTAFYDALPPQAAPLAPLSFGGPQLLITTDAVFRGTFPGQQLSMPVTLLGGGAPFAVNIRWGDSTNTVVSRNDNATFNITHTYAKPGTYQITLQASDASGRVAFLMVAAIINGQPPVAATGSSVNSSDPNGIMGSLAAGQILVLWPLYTGIVAVVMSFWMGERRERYLLTRRSFSHN